MSPFITLAILIAYFGLLMLIAKLTGSRHSDNNTFFLGNRQSNWVLVAIGMVGTSISGVSLISVPGMVANAQFTYMQAVLGFCFGYIVVALLLIPLYYRLNLTSIYGYLGNRFGVQTHRTGAFFFIIAKLVTSATKLYVAILVLQNFIFDAWQVPVWVTVILCVALIWLYTRHGGIRTIVWTDMMQTLFLLGAMVLMLYKVMHLMDLNLNSTYALLKDNPLSKVFVFDDWHNKRHFFKQFLSGIFIVIVMTGLNQDMMQKNLSCRNEKESKKNMLWYGMAFIPVNLLLLVLGALLIIYANNIGLVLPDNPDGMMPLFASSYLGELVGICFVIGIIAASFSSADSALTAVTTSIMIDLLNKEKSQTKADQILRYQIHLAVCIVFVGVVLLFELLNNQSVIDTIYTLVGYAYGPLLGLFAFGMLTKWQIKDRVVPYICIASPLLSYGIQALCGYYFNYQFGYELLMLNGMLTFAGLLLTLERRGLKRS